MNKIGKEWFEKKPSFIASFIAAFQLLHRRNQLGGSTLYCGCTDQVAGLAAHKLYIRLCIFKVFYLFNKKKAIYIYKWDFSVCTSKLSHW